MRRKFDVIQKFLRKGSKRVKAGQTWLCIHEEYGLGNLINQELLFTQDEIDKLRNLVTQKVGIDPLHGDLVGTRLAISTKGSANEKLSGKAVFGDLMQVARQHLLPISTAAGEAVTPAGTLLSVHAGVLDVSKIDKVVIIENGIIAANWHQLALPECCQDSLIIYRGHGDNAAMVKQLLSDLVPECEVYAFYDFDPAGLLMALEEERVTGLILPANWIGLTKGSAFVSQFNKTISFWEQAGQLTSLETTAPDSLRLIVKHIKRNELALMQEHLLVHKVELAMFDISV